MKNSFLVGVFGFALAGCVSSTLPPPVTPAQAVVVDSNASANADQCVGTSFDIYFSAGETEINEAAQAVIEKIATAYQPCEVNSLLVEGHSDATGTEASNLVVSEKRALSVVEALTNLGISPDRVRIAPKGEADAITSDGLIEPQNRKTTVRIVV